MAKKWRMPNAETIVSLGIILGTIITGVNRYNDLEDRVAKLNCDFITLQIREKKSKKLDYSSEIEANIATKVMNKDAYNYWKYVQEQIVILVDEVTELEERRIIECLKKY
jgi:hypothetical protein